MSKSMTIKNKIYIVAFTPIIVAIFISIGFICITNSLFSNLVRTTNKECLASTQFILNADRDAYQALSALQSIEIAKYKNHDEFVDAYKENIGQVVERIGKAEAILKTDKEKWSKYSKTETNNNLFGEFEMLKGEFDSWSLLANKYVDGDITLEQQQAQFDSAREHLNVVGEMVEVGSKGIIKDLEYQKNVAFVVLSSISLLTLIVLGLFSLSTSNMIARRLYNIVVHIKQLADKKLNIEKLKIMANDEIGELGNAINIMTDNLKEIISKVNHSVTTILSTSETMNASADITVQGAQQASQSTQQLAQGSQEISENIQHGAVTVNNVNRSIQDISRQAVEIAKLGNETEIHANTGSEQVKKAVVKIDSIKEVSEDISITITELGSLSAEIETIVDLIKNIAGQTNLLALNAAIEAARAGENGKGFAVVADEVKTLAGESAKATDKINEMIKEIQSKTNDAVVKMNKATTEVAEGVDVVNSAGEALEGIIARVKQTNDKLQQVSNEITNVAENSEEVVKMIENISAITEETAASAEEISSIAEEQTSSMQEISASSQSLANIAENLNEQISEFKI